MPILWAPGKIAFFLLENLHAHKIPRFFGGGGIFGVLGGRGGGRFYFYGRKDFLNVRAASQPQFLLRAADHAATARLAMQTDDLQHDGEKLARARPNKLAGKNRRSTKKRQDPGKVLYFRAVFLPCAGWGYPL